VGARTPPVLAGTAPLCPQARSPRDGLKGRYPQWARSLLDAHDRPLPACLYGQRAKKSLGLSPPLSRVQVRRRRGAVSATLVAHLSFEANLRCLDRRRGPYSGRALLEEPDLTEILQNSVAPSRQRPRPESTAFKTSTDSPSRATGVHHRLKRRGLAGMSEQRRRPYPG